MNNESDNLAESKASSDLEIAIPGLTSVSNQIAALADMATKLATLQGQFQLSQPIFSQSVNQLAERVSNSITVIKNQLANVTILDPVSISLLLESSRRWQELLHIRHTQRSKNWESWTDPSEWFYDFYTTSESGWLFIDFPDSALTRMLVNAPKEDRADILITHKLQLATAIEDVVGKLRPNHLSIYKAALEELLQCIRGENWLALQTLSMVFISSLGENELLGGVQIRRISLATIPDYESMSNDLELTAVVNSLLYFWPEDSHDLVRVSRNASLHHLDERQQTPQNAMQTLVNAVSLFMYIERKVN